MTRKTFWLSVLVAFGAHVGAAAASSALEPIQKLEKGEAAQRVGDEASVARLVDAVLEFPHSFEIPAEAKLTFGPGLKRAQEAYLLSLTSGVHERDVASLVNDLAISLRLPAFAQVSSRQVRVIRLKLVQDCPAFMGRAIISAGGKSINPYMSPLQAVHLVLMIADQKLLNEEYQVEPEQWETNHQPLRLGDGTPEPGSARHYSASAGASPRGAELRRSLSEAFQSMPLYDLSDLAARCLAKLGM